MVIFALNHHFYLFGNGSLANKSIIKYVRL